MSPYIVLRLPSIVLQFHSYSNSLTVSKIFVLIYGYLPIMNVLFITVKLFTIYYYIHVVLYLIIYSILVYSLIHCYIKFIVIDF